MYAENLKGCLLFCDNQIEISLWGVTETFIKQFDSLTSSDWYTIFSGLLFNATVQ